MRREKLGESAPFWRFSAASYPDLEGAISTDAVSGVSKGLPSVESSDLSMEVWSSLLVLSYHIREINPVYSRLIAMFLSIHLRLSVFIILRCAYHFPFVCLKILKCFRFLKFLWSLEISLSRGSNACIGKIAYIQIYSRTCVSKTHTRRSCFRCVCDLNYSCHVLW